MAEDESPAEGNADRARVEDELRRSEERFRLLFQYSSDLISVVNPDGSVRYASPAMTKLLGYTSENEPTSEEAANLIHPDDAAAAVEAFTAKLSAPTTDEPIRYRMRHADGSWRDLESIVTNLLHEPALQGLLVITRDITERQSARRRRLVGEFFSAVFAEQSDEILSRRAAAAALAAAPDYQVVSVSIDQAESAAGETFWHELSHRCREFEDQGCVWTAFAGIASVIVPVNESNDVVEIANRLERFAQELGGKRVIVSVGGRQPGVTGIKASLEEANNMLAVARQRGFEGVIRALDVIVPALLAASPRLADELVAMLDPLIEEDRRGRAALLQTLHTYVASSLSVHKTAEVLFVHRNTVRSRLRRIEELLGTRIAEVKLPIELALVAHEMRFAETNGSS